jgi:hypothetical protein
MRRAFPFVLVVCVLHAGLVRAQAGVAAHLRVGAGVAQREIQAPSAEGPRELALGPVPALMLGIDADAHAGAWVLGLGLSYRTSVRGRVVDADAGAGAAMSKTAVRSHHFEAGLRAAMRMGPTQHAVGVALFAGYDVRALATVAVLRVPRFSLHGPLLRVELDLPLRAANMRLRLGPEAQWISGLSRALLESSGLTQPAFAIGGFLQLQLPISELFALQLEYRESHAFARARGVSSFSDVERYLLLAAALRMP